ncbi:MAG: sugar transferase, partial [Pseudomonadota bacterium]
MTPISQTMGTVRAGHHPATPTWKRCGDVGLCVLLLPLFVLTACALLVINPFLNPGTLLFSQRRVGLRGHEFTIFKFRTMAGGSAIPRFAPEETARLTPLGGLLRRAHLDELPQIINILRGEMTFVGPRP